MKNVFVSLCFIFVCSFSFADAVKDWSDFETQLRKGNISAAEAEFLARKLTQNLSDYAAEKNITEDFPWTFPLKGYSKNDIADIKKFYRSLVEAASDTKFFEGDQFLGQKYINIEISTKNAAVSADVVAANNGIVVYAKRGALNSASGNCVWTFNPAQNFYIYYGYLRDVDVNLGNIVKTGDKIGNIRPSKKGYNLKFTVLMYGDDKFGLYPYLDDMQ
jgi:murein DD-endopeptidase MepM/ murein hydrolase activator NlpD